MIVSFNLYTSKYFMRFYVFFTSNSIDDNWWRSTIQTWKFNEKWKIYWHSKIWKGVWERVMRLKCASIQKIIIKICHIYNAEYWPIWLPIAEKEQNSSTLEHQSFSSLEIPSGKDLISSSTNSSEIQNNVIKISSSIVINWNMSLLGLI